MITSAQDPRKLSAYFSEEFAQQQLGGTTAEHHWRHDTAMRLFLSFAGAEVTIGEVTTETIDRFDAWLADPVTRLTATPSSRTQSPAHRCKMAYRYGSIIRRILSYADPSRFTARQRPQKEPGRRRPRWVRTEESKRAAARRALDSDEAGTVLHFFKTVYRVKRLRGKSDNTTRLYHNTIRNFSDFLGRTALVTDLVDDVVCGFLDWHRTTRENSAATCNKERSQLLSMANMAARKNLIPWLEVQPEIEPVRIPKAWGRDELRRLLESCGQEPGEVAGVPAGPWWRTLHLVLWDSGERIGAVMGLQWDDADLNSGWVKIRAELRKGGKSDIIRRLAPGTVAALQSIRQPDREKIFPWGRAPTDIYRFYKGIRERAGLPTGRKDGFHRMRKSVASHYAAAGGNATELLDHSSTRITKMYLDPTIAVQCHAADLLFRIDAPQAP